MDAQRIPWSGSSKHQVFGEGHREAIESSSPEKRPGLLQVIDEDRINPVLQEQAIPGQTDDTRITQGEGGWETSLLIADLDGEAMKDLTFKTK